MSSIPVEKNMCIGGFVAGTLTHTRDGLQPIERIKAGDFVLSKSNNGMGKPYYQRVTQSFEYDDKAIYLVSWSIVDSLIPWSKQESAFVVVTGNHQVWVERLVDRDDNNAKEIKEWMSIDEIYNINFEFNWLQNKAGVDAHIELYDTRIGQLASVAPLLQSDDKNIGVGFEDDVYWGDSYSGPGVYFQQDGPLVKRQGNGLFEKFKLNIDDTIDYDNYPKRSLIHRSQGFLPMHRKVFNIEVENSHAFYVGKTGILVHNILNL